MRRQWISCLRAVSGAAIALLPLAAASAADVTIDPHALPFVRKVDPRFQSYNVEMVEVVGGRFWAPYPAPDAVPAAKDQRESGGISIAAMFRKRDPINLKGDRRLRILANSLGPAYMRVSGAWANSTFFHDADTPPPAAPPKGYQSVLTRPQWAGVVDFAHYADAKLLVSFPVSEGARRADGSWDDDQARRMIGYTKQLGGSIAAAELVNEPNVGPAVGVPKGYDGARFAQDVAAFRGMLRTVAPVIRAVGPASTGEGGYLVFPPGKDAISTEQLMGAEPHPMFDVFSYHFYGTVSSRCAAMDRSAGIAPEQALSESWLARADQVFDHYKAVRDRYTPGAPIWVTEMAEAGCGGDRWAATYLDTFRYVDQMARLAKRGVDVIFHNTLSASDYALIDDVTNEPRPSYWAALLWRKLAGETVLDAGVLQPGLHLYAQCLRGMPGGVTIIAVNLGQERTVNMAGPVQRYTLTSDSLQGTTVKLNGTMLRLAANDALPMLKAANAASGTIALPAASISFLAAPKAGNPACR